MHSGKINDRRERNFIGSECAVCEEPLEHTLRGERILALSCSHVSHEACFYEYIKEFETHNCPTCDAPLSLDTSRGGGIDFDNLNKLVRAAQAHDSRESFRDPRAAPSVWDADTIRQSVRDHGRTTPSRPSRDHLLPTFSRSPENAWDRQTGVHGRHPSSDTGPVSSAGWSDSHHTSSRPHEYDVQSLESALSSPRHLSRNPIPTPTVTVRSEFPTLSKSRFAQNVTCLITVEVPDGKWRPTHDDFRRAGPVPAIPEEVYEEVKPSPISSPPLQLKPQRPVDSVHEDLQALEEAREALYKRMDNWHGLDPSRFGKLLLHGMVRVGKDRNSWQLLECYLFQEMLICAKEKKGQAGQHWSELQPPGTRRCTLKGSIVINKHLRDVEVDPETHTLTLSLTVVELPQFHLQFFERSHFNKWQRALTNVNMPNIPEPPPVEADQDTSGTDEEEYASGARKRPSSMYSSTYDASRSQATAPTEYSSSRVGAPEIRFSCSNIHVPIDIVVVVPVSPSMQGLKINLLRDALRFLVSSLGERDRLGLVTFGSGAGGVPLVAMTAKSWSGWPKVLEAIRPTGQKSMRADLIEGANVAMDLLMQRKFSNPLSSILVISDAAKTEPGGVDFVVSRAEAAKIPINSFGLGLTHTPDDMLSLSTKTKGSYTYVKDWMELRECIAGCLGQLQSTSHQNVRLKLRLPEGSPAKFGRIQGALSSTRRSGGRDAEALLGDLKFGDKRDIMVVLTVEPDTSPAQTALTDPWENVIAGLEALGGGAEQEESRAVSVEELPLIQADLSWGDLLRDGAVTQLPRPSLLTITVLPAASSRKSTHGRTLSPSIPSHPSVVQRRMELVAADMLQRALNLMADNHQHEKAAHILRETRTVLRGLGKGGLPALPPPPTIPLPAPPTASLPPTPTVPSTPTFPAPQKSSETLNSASKVPLPRHSRTPSPPDNESPHPFTPAPGIDSATMRALDGEVVSSLEYIHHPTVFDRDTRKSIMQAICVINSQRGYTFRTASESLWAGRNPGVKRLAEWSRNWRETTTAQSSVPEEIWT